MTEFEIEFIDEDYAVEVGELLSQNEKKKTGLDVFHGKCLVAINSHGKIIAFAEHVGKESVAYQVEISFFCKMGMKKKRRIKVALLERIFSKEFKVRSNISKEFRLQAKTRFMLPGG